MKRFWVYIIASRKHGTLYTGVTSDLCRRTSEHREGVVDGFTSRHRVKRLVYYEEHATAESAIQKHWSRNWKIQLIEQTNPDWNDLYLQLNR